LENIENCLLSQQHFAIDRPNIEKETLQTNSCCHTRCRTAFCSNRLKESLNQLRLMRSGIKDHISTNVHAVEVEIQKSEGDSHI